MQSFQTKTFGRSKMSISTESRPNLKSVLGALYKASATVFILYIIMYKPVTPSTTQPQDLNKFYHISNFLAWIFFSFASMASCEWMCLFTRFNKRKQEHDLTLDSEKEA
jgi:hypothetical protein